MGGVSTEALAGRVRRGALWGAVNVAASRILQFVSTIILARMLAPEYFGALAVAIVVQTIAMNAAELGATAAIARGDRDPDAVAPTVYTIALATSVSLTAVMVVTAPLLATAMGNASAAPVIQAMSVTVLLSGVSSVPAALLWRDYHQRQRAGIDLANALTALVLVVPMAMAGWGAMALAWSRVGGQVVATAGYLLASPRRVRPGFDRAVAGSVPRLGLPLALANLVVFAALNVDYVVIGRILGPEHLGLYLVAFNLAAIPSTLITAVVRTVAIPTFGRLFAAGRLADAAVQAVALMSYLAFLVSALLAGLGLPLVVMLYGERWAPAAVAMLGLGVFGAARILSELFADLSVGAGRTVELFWVQVAWFVALVPAMLLGVRLGGLAGAGVAHAVVTWLVVVPVYALVLRRATGVRLRALGRAALPGTVGGVAAGLAAWWVGTHVETTILATLLGGLAGTGVYVVATLPWARALLGQVRLALGQGPGRASGGQDQPSDLIAERQPEPAGL
jgi:O-antigen/teichoic acid export membrane protein